jgi:hypothetical protein
MIFRASIYDTLKLGFLLPIGVGNNEAVMS